MKKRKLVSKMLATTLALSITLPYLSQSLPQNLIASADDYSGDGTGGNSGVGSVNNGINFNDYGIRVYAIDQYGNIKTGNGATVVDLWNDSSKTSLTDMKKSYNSTCRFGTANKISIKSFSDGVKKATKSLQDINAMTRMIKVRTPRAKRQSLKFTQTYIKTPSQAITLKSKT